MKIFHLPALILLLIAVFNNNALSFELGKMSEVFAVYDSIGHKNKPDLKTFGLIPLRAIPTNMLWPKNTQDKTSPDLNWIASFAKELPNDNYLICLDIEHWHLHSLETEVIDNHIEYLVKIIKKIKEVRPKLLIGYYGIIPIRNYHAPVKSDTDKLSKWYLDNQYLQKLADNVDVIFPSLYTFYTNKEKWIIYAKANIKQAQQYGKPVIPFIWPQYHGSNALLKYKFLNDDYWKIQLETIHKHADGVAIWAPWGSSRAKWDSEAQWWKATLEFINTNSIIPSNHSSNLDF